jgi:L-seryl-tRNA(Ser) seleniumtransferase
VYGDPSAGSGDPRRRVPRTDDVLADPRLHAAAERLGRSRVKAAVHEAQSAARSGGLPVQAVADAALAALPAAASSLTPVLNATGVLLHTNLGRAPLSAAAVTALQRAAGYVDVEFDRQSGRRAGRGRGALAVLRAAVPAAGDVLVVNNGAAAVLLVATALAAGREIVVSRGELVEIGDGFRLPALVESTGATLREVGTTNRTTPDDYAAAMGERTAFVLKVHPSNFRITGFTASAQVAELCGLGVPVVVDIGSGLLHPDRALPAEPDVTSTLAAGAALVTASGDKLLGGPQAGLVFGQAELVGRLRRHPMARALRVDKLTLAALEATVAGPAPPAVGYLHADEESLRRRAEALAGELAGRGQDAVAVPCASCVGGGGAPGVPLPSYAVSLPAGFAGPLRLGEPAVVGRTEGGRLLLDLRCVPAGDDGRLLDAVLSAAKDG